MLTSDTVIVAYFTSPLGIEPAGDQPGYVIMSQHQRITIQGAENQPIDIYDLLGRRIASANSRHAANATFQLPASGIYIVCIGHEKPVKLLIR